MITSIEEITRKIQKLEENIKDCNHPENAIEVRQRKMHHVRQCTICGHHIQNVPKDKDLSPPEFDENQKTIYEEQKKKYKKEIELLKQEKRRLEHPPKDSKVEGQANFFDSDEDELKLKQWFEKQIDSDFYIYRESEIKGMHLFDSEINNKYPDYILRPKKHLIDEGFVDDFFVVEVKYLRIEKSFIKQASNALWQTISYMDFSYEHHNRRADDLRPVISSSPNFSVLFSNLSFQAGIDELHSKGLSSEKFIHFGWDAMLDLANEGRAGQIIFKGSKEKPDGWFIQFGRDCRTKYFEVFSKGIDRLYKKDLVNRSRKTGNVSR